MKKNNFMNVFKHIARILIGITFIFSGFVKGIDPWGSTYKFTDYFHAMGLEWLGPLAFTFGILLALSEFLIGISHLFVVKIRFFSWAALLYMIFFTPITLWLALKNPVTDCGCFGDALVITNWQTFYKNIILLAMAIIVVIHRKDIVCFGGQKTGMVLGVFALTAYLVSVVHSYRHEPLLDFRPYKVGVNIMQGMTVPANAPRDEYRNTLYYKNKKTGKIAKFNEKEAPWQDTLNWEFSRMDEPVLVKKGYTPPIHGFSIDTRDGENVYDYFLNDDKYVFILIAYNLDKSSLKNQAKINQLAVWAKEQHLSFIGLTASPRDNSDKFIIDHEVPFEFFNCDETALKTIVRSNPGLLVLKKGTVVAKYHYNDIPTPEEFKRKFLK